MRSLPLRAASDAAWALTPRIGSFGTLLGLILPRDGGSLRMRHLDDSTSEWSLPWPRWACRRDGHLSLGAALAIADEVSSYGAMACWDRWHRPGVTVSLSGMLVSRRQGGKAGRTDQEIAGGGGDGGTVLVTPPVVEAGEELSFVSRRLKTGRQLGYMEIEVWRGSPSASEPAELVAIGRHSKMLSLPGWPMRLVELGGHPALFPWLQPLALSACATRPLKPWPPLSPADRSDVFPPLVCSTSSWSSGATSAAAAAEQPQGGGEVATFVSPLRPRWANALGHLHGGAACMLGEQIASAPLAYRARMRHDGDAADADDGAGGVAAWAAAAREHPAGGGLGGGVDYDVSGAPPVRVLSATLLSSLVCDGRPAVFEARRDPGVGDTTLATLRHASDRGVAAEVAVMHC